MKRIITLLISILMLLGVAGCSKTETVEDATVYHSTNTGTEWIFGYGVRPIIAAGHVDGQGLYIAGYQNGAYATGYLWRKAKGRTDLAADYCEAKAVWMDAGDGGVLLIGIDCVALSRTTTEEIRSRLYEACTEAGAIAVHVYATHTHAGPDTLGLWGPIGMEGKNEAYMTALVDAAVEAGETAMKSLHTGELRYGQVETKDILFDSRDPQIYDPNLYQFRFTGDDGGVRLLFYGAHAESLRGDNLLLSRDFPGVLCDTVEEETGEPAIYLPGAIGGLLYTKALTGEYFVAVKNMEMTGEALAEAVLSITPEKETTIAPSLSHAATEFIVPLDNPLFLYYKFLGILGNTAEEGESATGYRVKSEMSLLRLGDVHIAMIPGEIFPELVLGGECHTYGTGGENPIPLREIAAGHGIDELLILGLCDDELGYIVPPSDFLVHETAPYLEKIKDPTGENHYEETNSTGPATARIVAQTFEKLVLAMGEGE